jgi:hypothetical protein
MPRKKPSRRKKKMSITPLRRRKRRSQSIIVAQMKAKAGANPVLGWRTAPSTKRARNPKSARGHATSPLMVSSSVLRTVRLMLQWKEMT